MRRRERIGERTLIAGVIIVSAFAASNILLDWWDRLAGWWQ